MRPLLVTVLIAVRTAALLMVITGLAYPGLVTLVGQLVFPDEAAGSLVVDAHGQVIGSALIAQPFAMDAYFQPRPSGAGDGYDPMQSGSANLGPTALRLKERATDALVRLAAQNGGLRGRVPAELATQSASGLDPHLSPEAALWQVPRVARARHVGEDRIRTAVLVNIEPPTFGLLGEPRVNVLLLNLALDRQFGMPTRH